MSYAPNCHTRLPSCSATNGPHALNDLPPYLLPYIGSVSIDPATCICPAFFHLLHPIFCSVSSPHCPSSLLAAAGGRFRGSIGRALFRTTGVYQSVLEPDIATNKASTARHQLTLMLACAGAACAGTQPALQTAPST